MFQWSIQKMSIRRKHNTIEARKTLTGKSIIVTVYDEFGNQASKLLTTRSVQKLITKLKKLIRG